MDTWLDAIRNLRNVCAHHNRLVGRTSPIVLPERHEINLLTSQTDLFSRLYALKKVLNEEDGNELKKDLQKIIRKAKFDVYQFNILPSDWEILYDDIKSL